MLCKGIKYVFGLFLSVHERLRTISARNADPSARCITHVRQSATFGTSPEVGVDVGAFE